MLAITSTPNHTCQWIGMIIMVLMSFIMDFIWFTSFLV